MPPGPHLDTVRQKDDFFGTMSNAVTTAEAERDVSSARDDKPQMREYTVTFIKDGKPIPDPFSDMPPLPPLEPYELVWKNGIQVPSRPLTGAEIAERMSSPDWPRMSPEAAEEWADAVEEIRRLYNTPVIP